MAITVDHDEVRVPGIVPLIKAFGDVANGISDAVGRAKRQCRNTIYRYDPMHVMACHDQRAVHHLQRVAVGPAAGYEDDLHALRAGLSGG